ncbi:unnamed protein product, partial [Staurois parvus]
PGPRIHYIRSLPGTPHSLYPLSPDPAFTISALPETPPFTNIRSPRTRITTISASRPRIHYIPSPPRPRTSLYHPLSPDPAFTISALTLPDSRIHYIRSPRTPAFTISALPRTPHSLY